MIANICDSDATNCVTCFTIPNVSGGIDGKLRLELLLLKKAANNCFFMAILFCVLYSNTKLLSQYDPGRV